MLHLTAALDPASGVPLYEQLYRSIAAEISAGTLPAGARMPGKRSLAEELSERLGGNGAVHRAEKRKPCLRTRAEGCKAEFRIMEGMG